MYKRAKHFFRGAARRACVVALVWLLILQMVSPALILADDLTSTPSADVAASVSPSPSEAPTSTMDTGDAYATAVATVLTDTTLIDSTVSAVQGDVVDPNQGDIDLTTPSSSPSASPEATESGTIPTPAPAEIDIEIDNTATSTASVAASAVTGGNSQDTPGEADMHAGDAAASAYATTLTNTTLVNSTIQVALLSIFANWNGNILIDPSLATPSAVLSPMTGYLEISNTGDVILTADASARTGDNSQTTGGDATTQTGSAMSVASVHTLADTTLVDVDIFDFFVQNPWLWTGGVYNWLFPGSRQSPDEVLGRNIAASGGSSCDGCTVNLAISNSGDVATTVTATADTGGNTQTASGSAYMTTGDAYASAQAAVVANTTLINSRYRLLSINVLAPWTGNLIVPYPDLALMVSAPDTVAEGEDIPFTVTVTNQGYEAARPVRLGYAITNDTHPVVTSAVDEPDLPPGASVSQTFTFPTTGRGGATILFQATASTPMAEESTSNNTASVSTLVQTTPGGAQPAAPSDEIPTLSLTAKNNIATFIYPGDTVRYEAVITNVGPGIARDTVFSQAMVTKDGEIVRGFVGAVGDIPAGGNKTIRFSMVTSPELSAGTYYTESIVRGRSDNSTAIASNVVENIVPVHGRGGGIVQGVGAISPEILGVNLARPGGAPPITCASCNPGIWYLLLTTGSLSYLFSLERLRRKIPLPRLVGLGLVWPLFVYGFYLVAHADCRSGIAITSPDPWCRWLLPAAIALYLLITAGGRGLRHAVLSKIEKRLAYIG